MVLSLESDKFVEMASTETANEDETSRILGNAGAMCGSRSYGSMEVENGSYGVTPQQVSGGGDASGAIELLKTSSGNGTGTAGTQPCMCSEGGMRCNTAAAPSIRLQLETWSPQKTIILVAIVVTFAVWAVVFGVCLNWFNL